MNSIEYSFKHGDNETTIGCSISIWMRQTSYITPYMVRTTNVNIGSCAPTEMIEFSILDSVWIFHVFLTEQIWKKAIIAHLRQIGV